MKRIVLLILMIALFKSAAYAQVPDFTLTDCNYGQTHNLYNDLAAGNTIVLNMCAAWCGPCQAAEPQLEQVYQDFCTGNANVKVYSFLFEDFDHNENTDCAFAVQFASYFGTTFPVFTNVGDFNSGLVGQYFTQYAPKVVPTYLIIHPNMSDPANSQVELMSGYDDNLLRRMITMKISGVFCSDNPSDFTATLTSNFPTGNNWSTGDTTQSITVNSAGPYTLTLNNGSCPTTSYTSNIEFNTLPVVGIASISNNSPCAGGNFILDYTVPAGFTGYSLWAYTLPGNPNDWLYYAPADAGPINEVASNFPPGSVYKFRVESFYGNSGSPECYAISNEVVLTISSDLPGVTSGTATISENLVCQGTTYVINYSDVVPGSIWQYFDSHEGWLDWVPADQGPIGITDLPQTTVNGLPGNGFRVKIPASNPIDCYSVSNVVKVAIAPPYPLTATITGANVGGIGPYFCAGSSVTLTATISDALATNLTWSPSGETTPSITVSPTTSADYTITFTDRNTCPHSSSIHLTSFTAPTPVITSGATVAVCPGTPVTLSYTGGNSVAPCTNDVYGQWPNTLDILCDGSTTIVDDGYAGEYSKLNLNQGAFYSFSSTDYNNVLRDDIVTITDSTGATVYATGKGIAYLISPVTGAVRFYTHSAGCGSNTIARNRRAKCLDISSSSNFLWSPSGATSPSITVNPTSTTTYSLTFTVSEAPACPSTTSIQVVVNPLPTQGTVTGPAKICKNQTGIVYTAGGIANATSYVWTLPAQMIPVNGSLTTATNTITVKTTGTFAGGSVKVKGSNACGFGTISPAFAVSAFTSVPSTPTAINGVTGNVYGFCPGNTYTFTTTANNATEFKWTVSCGTIVSGQGTNNISLLLSGSYSKCEIKVKGINCIGSGNERELDLKSVLPAPTISGSNSACKNSNTSKTYTVSGVSGAASYSWSSATSSVKFSTGGTPTNPFTTTSSSVTVNFFNVATGTRNIMVTANNNCGSSPMASKNVTVSNCSRVGDEESTTINENSLTAYPNPTKDELNLSWYSETATAYSLKVISITGQVVISKTENAVEGDNESHISLSNIVSGLYTIILQSDEKMIQTRVVKN